MIFLKNKFNFYILIVFFGALGVIFIFGEVVFALSTNYSKVNNEALSVLEWNTLATDFLANSGGGDGVMSGGLDLNGNKITTVGAYSGPSDVVNKEYIDGLVVSTEGGVVFRNIGREDCPSGTNLLYSGFLFGTSYRDGGGSSNNICIQAGTAGSSAGGAHEGKVYPLITSIGVSLLPSEIPDTEFIRCAVCYNPGSTCYESYNTWSCSGSYSAAYEGYLLGAIKTASVHYSSRERECVNKNFDNTTISASTPGSSEGIMYGSRIEDNYNQSSYSELKFVRCAVCCN